MLRECKVYLLHGRKPRFLAVLALTAAFIVFIVQLKVGFRPDRECCLCPKAARILFHPNPKDGREKTSHATVVGREFAKTMSRDTGPHIFMVIAPGKQLTDHQACSVESAALHHPGHNVHLLLLDEPYRAHSYIDVGRITHLSHIKNVRLWHIETADIFSGSPLQDWYYNEFMRMSFRGDPNRIIMDVVKVLLLWKFGGIILDPDFVVLKTLDDDKYNNAIVEDGENFPMTHFLGFQKSSKILSTWMKEFEASYNAHGEHDPGSVILMRSIRSVCNISALDEVDVRGCKLTVIKSRYFFPVHQKEAADMFKNDRDMTPVLKNSLAVWLWSDRVRIHQNNMDSSSYRQLMRDNCPTIDFQNGMYVYKGGSHSEM